MIVSHAPKEIYEAYTNEWEDLSGHYHHFCVVFEIDPSIDNLADGLKEARCILLEWEESLRNPNLTGQEPRLGGDRK